MARNHNKTTKPQHPSTCCNAQSHVRRVLSDMTLYRCSACGELWGQDIHRHALRLVWSARAPEVERERHRTQKLRLVTS